MDAEQLKDEVNALKRKLKMQKEEFEEKKKKFELEKEKLEAKVEKIDERDYQLDQREQDLEFKDEEFDIKTEELKTSKSKIQKLMQEVNNKLECPVCLDIPRGGPVPVCPNGHIVCAKCKTDSCPTCRGPMGEGRSLLAVAILENIEHSCKFHGCTLTFPLEVIEEHEIACEHRTVACPSCPTVVTLAKLVDHLLDSEDCCKQTKLKLPFTFETWVRRGYNMKLESRSKQNISWPLTIYSINGQDFAIFPLKSEGQYYFMVVMFASEKECSKLKLEIVVHEHEVEVNNTDTAVKFLGMPLSIDSKKKDLKLFGTGEQLMNKILDKSVNKTGFSMSFKISRK